MVCSRFGIGPFQENLGPQRLSPSGQRALAYPGNGPVPKWHHDLVCGAEWETAAKAMETATYIQIALWYAACN
jgi:hypothetical protein